MGYGFRLPERPGERQYSVGQLPYWAGDDWRRRCFPADSSAEFGWRNLGAGSGALRSISSGTRIWAQQQAWIQRGQQFWRGCGEQAVAVHQRADNLQLGLLRHDRGVQELHRRQCSQRKSVPAYVYAGAYRELWPFAAAGEAVLKAVFLGASKPGQKRQTFR